MNKQADVLWMTGCLAAVVAASLQAQPREFGVDVSHFQGESGISQAGWDQMFAAGRRFAFIKATEGLTGPDDAAMTANVMRATAAGLRAGVYHYAHPENRPTPAGAVQEADHFLIYAGNFIGPGYLRPVLDVEFSAALLGTTELTDWIIAFCDRVSAMRGSGAEPIIYCNQSFAANEFDSRLAGYTLWLRVISGAVDPAVDQPPGVDPTGVFDNWSFWQYSDAGSIGGISPLDLNVCQSEYQLLDSYLIPINPSPVAPDIATQPQSQSVTLASSATFSVGVSVASSTPLSYRWQFQGTDISGATGTAYTRTNVQASDAGAYRVVITNAAGSLTSAVAQLYVLTPLTLYEENFDAYSSPVTVMGAGTTNGFRILSGAAAGAEDFTATFGFDYAGVSYPATVPSAPRSTGGTTRGLNLTVNKDLSGAAAAVNFYPLSQNFTGNFALKFDLWINWATAATATEHALFGINHSGLVMNRVGQTGSDGLFFAVDGDGGATSTSATIRDFAVFRGAGPGGIPLLTTSGFGPAPLLGAQFDNLNPGFGGLFPAKTFDFTTPAGSAGMEWVRVEVRQVTNLVTWYLNDTLVAQYANSTPYTNGTVMIGYNDLFSSIGGVNNFAIFDNLRVETAGPDLDLDGLMDTWEVQYFGSQAAEPDADDDGDGVFNITEQAAGTNPTNAASALRMLSAVPIDEDIRVEWTTAPDRSYVVQHLPGAAGLTGTFVDLSPVIPAIGTNEATAVYLHPGGATNTAGYYRVRLW